MAKGNFLMNTVSGKLGSMVLYRASGEQRSRTYIKAVANPKSRSQMLQRTQLSNLVAMYRVIKQAIQRGFEAKTASQSDYNLFVGRNLGVVPVYLSRQMQRGGACVVAPYVVTEGSLMPIQTSGNGTDTVTNIAVPAEFSITEDTTVGELSQALLSANSWLASGMQLSYLSIVQSQDVETGYPVCYCNKFEMTLALNNSTKVRDIFPEYALSVVDGFIGHGDFYAAGAFCWILSQKDVNGKLRVSTQRLIVTDDSLYQSYTTPSAFQIAADSYGVAADAFLTPGNSGSSVESGVAAVSSVFYDSKNIRQGDFGGLAFADSKVLTINGTMLNSANIKIFTSESESKTPSGTVLSSAQAIGDLVTISTDTATVVSGTWKGGSKTVNEIAIVQDDTILFQVYSEGGESPMG